MSHTRSRRVRLLILSCTGGAGHLRAASALAERARRWEPQPVIEEFDVLEFTPPWFRRWYAESYIDMVNHAPALWGYLYERTEQRPYRTPALMKAFDRINYDRYWRALGRLRPDVLLCTHFLPYLSVGTRLLREVRRPRVIAAATDFDVHRLWIHPVVDRYCVFNDETAWQLASKGVAGEHISVTGIPVHAAFGERRSRRRWRHGLGLAESRPTIAVLSGGFGVGRIREVIAAVMRAVEGIPGRRWTVLAVCGRNERAEAELRRVEPPPGIELRVFGFVNNVHEIMGASDIVVTKSGGLTSSEALAMGVPMLVVDPIPGQETRNASLIVDHGAGWQSNDMANLTFKLRRALQTPRLLTSARAASRALGRPQAARDILRIALRPSD